MFSYLHDNAIVNINKIIKNPGILFFETGLALVFKLIPIKYLKQLGISTFCYIEDKSLTIKANHIYYIINNDGKICRLICKYIENNKNSIHHIIFISQANLTCQRIFEYHGLWQYIKIYQLHIDTIPFEEDILLIQDRSLATIQKHLGSFPIIQGIGINAQTIVENLDRQDSVVSAKIGRLIIIDRECDPITPLLSQTSYAGILDDIYHFDRDIITIEEKKYILNNDDTFYKLLKDKPIELATKTIVEMVKEYNNFTINKKNGVGKQKLLESAKNFVPKEYLDKHFTIIENVIKIMKTNKYQSYLSMEQQIMIGDIRDINSILLYQPACSLIEILRLLCLFCIVNDGITQNELELIRRTTILQYQEIFIVDNLVERRLLFTKNGQSWNKIVEKFNLFPHDYVPLLCRLVENALICDSEKIYHRKKGILYRGFCDVKTDKKMRLISNDVFTLSQETSVNNGIILVYIIGGITRDEIAILRALSKEIIIASNKIINNSTIIDNCQNGVDISI